jgi:TRAP-type C4-dicarboxylate transport system permease small subunit
MPPAAAPPLSGMRRALAVFRRLVEGLDKATMALCALLLASVVCLSAVEIVGRSFFATSSIEMVDLALQLSILMNFVGYLVLLNRNQDIEIDYFYARLPAAVRRAVDILTALAIVGFFLLLLVKSIRLFRMGLRFNHPVFPIPQAVITLPAVLGSAGGLIVAIRKALDVIFEPGRVEERQPGLLD